MAAALRPVHVVLVDDDAFLRDTLPRLLRDRLPPGSSVQALPQAAPALAAVESSPWPTVALCDFDLRSTRDGADFLLDVRRSRPHVRRILYSGQTGTAFKQAVARCLPDAAVEKRLGMDDLVDDLVAAIGDGQVTAKEPLPPALAAAPSAQASLQAVDLEESYRLLVESVRDYAIFLLDPTGRIASWNPGAERIKGYTASEAIGKSFKMFYPEEDRQRNHPEEELALAVRNGRYEEEGIRLRKDGTKFWANVVITALYGPNGTLRGFAKVTRDLTARKALEEELRRQAERYGDLSRELETFNYTVAHDLRSPIRAILHAADTLRKNMRVGLDEAALQDVDTVRVQALRMSQLMDDLLALSSSTKGELRSATVNLTQLARSAAAEALDRSERPPGQAVVEDGLTAVGDARFLRIVLDNLLSNAVKFTSQTPQPRIEVGRTRHGDEWAFFVRDNGVGFEGAYANRLFRPFQRLHSAAEYEGTGIGLATVARIVERHGGRAWIESQPGRGTTAYFTLPGTMTSRSSTILDASQPRLEMPEPGGHGAGRGT